MVSPVRWSWTPRGGPTDRAAPTSPRRWRAGCQARCPARRSRRVVVAREHVPERIGLQGGLSPQNCALRVTLISRPGKGRAATCGSPTAAHGCCPDVSCPRARRRMCRRSRARASSASGSRTGTEARGRATVRTPGARCSRSCRLPSLSAAPPALLPASRTVRPVAGGGSDVAAVGAQVLPVGGIDARRGPSVHRMREPSPCQRNDRRPTSPFSRGASSKTAQVGWRRLPPRTIRGVPV